jgi:hypothetical protein
MTMTPTELGLSTEAKFQLDKYLHQVRSALAAVPDVNLDEIESDILEHVEQELVPAARPVPPALLEEVLNRLGPPTQWLPPGHHATPTPLPSVFSYLKAQASGMFSALWRGPEDWRLAYLSFFIFAIGVVAFTFVPLLLIISYLLARAGIAAAHQKSLEIDAGRKWLLYPQTSLVSLAILLILVLGPPVAASVAAITEAHDLDIRERRQNKTVTQKLPIGQGKFVDKEYTTTWLNPDVVTTPDRIFAQFPGDPNVRPVLATVFFVAGILIIWLAVLGLFTGTFPAFVRALVFPFLQRFEGRSSQQWGLVCLMLAAAWCGIGYRVVMEAGL